MAALCIPFFSHLLRCIIKTKSIKRCSVINSTIYKEQIMKLRNKKKTNSSCTKTIYHFRMIEFDQSNFCAF